MMHTRAHRPRCEIHRPRANARLETVRNTSATARVTSIEPRSKATHSPRRDALGDGLATGIRPTDLDIADTGQQQVPFGKHEDALQPRGLLCDHEFGAIRASDCAHAQRTLRARCET